MASYLLAYTGGSMAETEAEREEAMAAWGQWFGSSAPRSSTRATRSDPPRRWAGGADGAAKSGLSGYSVITADSLAAAPSWRRTAR